MYGRYLEEQGKAGGGGEGNVVRVKISGNGTIVGKSNHFVNVMCTVLNAKEEEKYEILKAHL